MVSLTEVHAHNATLSSLPANLVAVFVGGTSGIGLFTARELARNTVSPTIYLIGRNASEASKITSELQLINPSSRISFIQKDVSLLRNVDAACAEITAQEKEINLLFMTCGYLTLRGREETSEGLDRKFALHYYTRMRFITQLSQPLSIAAQSSRLSRVVSVMDPQAGLRAEPNYADLSLKSTFSLKNCFVHASAMQNLALGRMAKEMPGTAFVHAYPSGVDTGVMRELPGVFNTLLRPLLYLVKPLLLVPQRDSGERHLFAATALKYPAKGDGGAAEHAAVGSDGVVGSGSYLLNWNGEILSDTQKARAMRDSGAAEKVWEHTEEVFAKICDGGGVY